MSKYSARQALASQYAVCSMQRRKKVFFSFYKITSSKNYNAGKDEKFILLVKRYLPTTLI